MELNDLRDALGELAGVTTEEIANLYTIVYDTLDRDRALLNELFAVVKCVRDGKTPDGEKDAALGPLVTKLIAEDERLIDVNSEIIRKLLLIIHDEPPKSPPCHLELILLQRYEDGTTFAHHKNISNVLLYLDVDSLISLSSCSKSTYDAVKIHMNKTIYNLPFNKGQICSNLNYWRQTIEFFFKYAATLKPIDRMNYPNLLKQLNINKSTFPITSDSMRAHVYVTFDHIQPHYIVYCNHEEPMSHTCSASNAIDCESKAVTKVITASDFISEYKQRLEVKDDQIVWGSDTEHITKKYVCLLLKSLLDTISSCISKHDGQVEYRRTEYVANAKHHITHRIWLQLSLKWDFRFGQESQNSLFLTIADHYKWDG